MRPVVHRIAYHIRYYRRKSRKFIIVVGVACDVFFFYASRAHKPPLIVISAQKQFGRVFKNVIVGYLFGRQMTMIVDYRHLFGIFVIKAFCLVVFKHEAVVYKTHFSSPSCFL